MFVRQRRSHQRQGQHHYQNPHATLDVLDDISHYKVRPGFFWPKGWFTSLWKAIATTSRDCNGCKKRLRCKYRGILPLTLVVCYSATRSLFTRRTIRPDDNSMVNKRQRSEHLVVTLRNNIQTIRTTTHVPHPFLELQLPVGNSDYDGLQMSKLTELNFDRRISTNDDADYEVFRGALLETMNKHFVESQYFHDDELEDETMKCRRNNWQRKVIPNCNDFHTTALERPFDGVDGKEEQLVDVKFLGEGYFRAVWLFESPVLGPSVLKRIRLHKLFPLNYKDLYKVHRDAIIMERLTSSPRIVNIYGHCGFSILSEAMRGEITSEMMYKSGHMDPQDLNDTEKVRPLNNYTVDQKLQIALDMAESIADLHGYVGGVIMHGDVHPVQWLRAADESLKLNDFNNAEILDWDGKQYCKWWRMYGGMYRSPEEFRGDIVDEKMDVFSMGNNIYVLLTGLFPFYSLNSYEEIQKRVINGTRPFVDERYKSRSFGEYSLVHIMEQCWEYDPKKRPDIFEVVRFLRKTINENNIATNRVKLV